MLWIAVLGSPAVSAPGADLLPPAQPKFKSPLPIQSILLEAEERAKTGDEPLDVLRAGLADQGFVTRDDAAVLVEVSGPRGAPPIAAELIARFGGQRADVWRSWAEAWMPPDRLGALARALPEGYYLMRAQVAMPDDVVGEGPAAIGSDLYRDAGADGTGITVAVIDADYFNLTPARINGDAPPLNRTTMINYTFDAFEFGTSGHGTACVEIIYDHAPGASYRLYKILSFVDVGNAVNDAIANGVDVSSHSLSWYNLGWEDDVGIACDAANEAGESGILFFTSAGNRAQSHWQGNFNPGAGSSLWHDWSGGDETIDVTMPPGTGISFRLSWDIEGGIYDYDLYLYDSTATNVLASSTNLFNFYEELTYTNTGASQITVKLAVLRDSGAGITEFEVFGHDSGGAAATWEYSTAAGSTTSPSNATHPNVISNGDVPFGSHGSPNGTTGILSATSSRGASNSGMILPDFCGPTGTTGFAYPTGFTGTSSATPNNAGAACAFWSSDPLLNADGVGWLLLELSLLLKDWGPAGNDNAYGRGGSALIPYLQDTIWVARNNFNVLADRGRPFFTVPDGLDAAVGGGRLVVLPGGYPEPVTISQDIVIQGVMNPAILGATE